MSPALDPYQTLWGTFIPFCWVFICKGLFTLICFYSGVLPRLYDDISLRRCGFPLSVIGSVRLCPFSNCSMPHSFPLFPTDSDNSLLRYLSDDKILVIEEEPEGPGRESRRDSTRRSRRKSRNPSSPSFPISPSMLSSTLRLDQPPDALPVCTELVVSTVLSGELCFNVPEGILGFADCSKQIISQSNQSIICSWINIVISLLMCLTSWAGCTYQVIIMVDNFYGHFDPLYKRLHAHIQMPACHIKGWWYSILSFQSTNPMKRLKPTVNWSH